jgi:predicted membrane-bound spermidine synthase/Flp pilus assembly protein TadD
MSPVLLYVLFFCSGLSGLVYQAVWVRQLNIVFGATIYSTSLVVSLFMLGLGVGSFVIGRWADRRYIESPDSLLRAYGVVELTIGALGLTVSLVLPLSAALVAPFLHYTTAGNGWFLLSRASYAAQGMFALGVLGPITLLLGGTLTLLIRHRVRADVERAAGWKIAMLYAVNTAGAAAGAFLADFALVPAIGLRNTQWAAVALNIVAGVGALAIARSSSKPPAHDGRQPGRRPKRSSNPVRPPIDVRPAGFSVVWVGIALVFSGCNAFGMEMIWLRHFTLLLGGFRAVFALVLTVMLSGIAVGALIGGVVDRWTPEPARSLIVLQALLVPAMMLGLSWTSFSGLESERQGLAASLAASTPAAHRFLELWYELRPIVIELGLPSILMGGAFPLANAVVQHVERSVGARAGLLYLANTGGAVGGSLVTAYVLLPRFGTQASATLLMLIGAAAVLPLTAVLEPNTKRRTLVAPALVMVLSFIGWVRLPADHILRHSMPPGVRGERMVAVHEGLNAVVAVLEKPGVGRSLMTNGHAMASTAMLDQRYMRALVHIPLLAASHPARVLVIGFGVGNSTHAATLHPDVERVEVADLSREILEHADYFRDANRDVLHDARVRVFLNDGRLHLQMQPRASYDLITLEPPPIAQAGVASLYSREFYELARSRLKPGGYLSQWLPAYQVTAGTALAMVRAFVDVFPQAVLLSGMQNELLLVGTNGPVIQVDPDRLASELAAAPNVADDLRRIDLATATQIVGTFVGSAATLARATRDTQPVSDDRPRQEYDVRSALGPAAGGVPAALFDLSAASAWCPKCFDGERPVPSVAGLDTYLALLDEAYHAPAGARPISAGRAEPASILGSRYLGAILPDNDAVYNVIGVARLRENRYTEAAAAFREALDRRADSSDANRNLGTALAAMGRPSEAITYLRRAVALAPDNGGAQYELGNLLLARQELPEAAASLQAATRALPDFAAAHDSYGIALARLGDWTRAIEQFQIAVGLDPGFGEARDHLAAALRARR